MTAQEPAVALKSCPFCSGPAILHCYHEAEGKAAVSRVYWVTCDETKPAHCHASSIGVPVSNRQSAAEAIAAWNHRAREAELVAALRELHDVALTLEIMRRDTWIGGPVFPAETIAKVQFILSKHTEE